MSFFLIETIRNIWLILNFEKAKITNNQDSETQFHWEIEVLVGEVEVRKRLSFNRSINVLFFYLFEVQRWVRCWLLVLCVGLKVWKCGSISQFFLLTDCAASFPESKMCLSKGDSVKLGTFRCHFFVLNQKTCMDKGVCNFRSPFFCISKHYKWHPRSLSS